MQNLEEHSLLYQAPLLVRPYIGNKVQWQHPFGYPQSHNLCEKVPNWIQLYPLSLEIPENHSVFSYLSSNEVLNLLEETGFHAIQMGPFQFAGKMHLNGKISPSVDGGFDPIAYSINESYGSMEDFKTLNRKAKAHEILLIGDVIPVHTGIGPDFLLALMNFKEYPGLYQMVEIAEKDWSLLPTVPEKDFITNLSITEVENLREKKYITGVFEKVIFYQKNEKETNWSVTCPIKGVDGQYRRWVYLHYFKQGQPALNWLDPTFAAHRIIAATIVHNIQHLHIPILRMDANPYLGNEPILETKKAFSTGHPLSITISNEIAMMTRKFGGFSFQELNLSLKNIRAFSQFGADLTYDFFLRSCGLYSLIEQNTDLLKLGYKELLHYGLQPIQFVHGLQNHDEINFEWMHFLENFNESFVLGKNQFSGASLYQKLGKIKQKVSSPKYFYNLSSKNGPCTTLVGLIAASLNIKNIYCMSCDEKRLIQKIHLLYAFFNAMQPGVFCISGWDLVGALPLQQKNLPKTPDTDFRWANRGSYSLIDYCDERSIVSELPKAEVLYGSLTKQNYHSESFLKRLQKILRARQTYSIHLATLLDVVETQNPSVFILLHRLPGTQNLQITAVNFSSQSVQENLFIEGIEKTTVIDMMDRTPNPQILTENYYELHLTPWEGKALVFQPR